LSDLQAIKAVFNQHQPSLAVEFPAVEKLLRRAQHIFNDALGVETASEGAAEVHGGNGQGAVSTEGPLRTRADARRQLESVCEFL
jgi:hypothetical protein